MVRLRLGLTNSYNLFHTRDLTPAILNAIYDATIAEDPFLTLTE